jgi:hypothetical protein
MFYDASSGARGTAPVNTEHSMGGHLRVKQNSHSGTGADKKLAMSQHSALHACYTRTGFPWFRGRVSDLRPS